MNAFSHQVGESNFGVLGDAAIVYPPGVSKLSIGGAGDFFVQAPPSPYTLNPTP